jgi:hypothetical protein
MAVAAVLLVLPVIVSLYFKKHTVAMALVRLPVIIINTMRAQSERSFSQLCSTEDDQEDSCSVGSGEGDNEQGGSSGNAQQQVLDQNADGEVRL